MNKKEIAIFYAIPKLATGGFISKVYKRNFYGPSSESS